MNIPFVDVPMLVLLPFVVGIGHNVFAQLIKRWMNVKRLCLFLSFMWIIIGLYTITPYGFDPTINWLGVFLEVVIIIGYCVLLRKGGLYRDYLVG